MSANRVTGGREANVSDSNKAAEQQLQAATATLERLAGNVFERLGMRRVDGRAWAVLFLCEESLDAENLRAHLGISSGAMSMTLGRLTASGLIYRELASQGRRYFYRAEGDLWVVIIGAYRDKWRGGLADLLDELRAVEGKLEKGRAERVHHLVNVTEFLLGVLDAAMERTRMELKAAHKLLSMSGRLRAEPLGRLRRVLSGNPTDRRKK